MPSAKAKSSTPLPTLPVRRGHRLRKESQLSPKRVHAFLRGLFEEDLHAKRVMSLAAATTGVIHAAALSIHAIGQGLAQAAGLRGKHAVKQVDRLLSNAGIDLPTLFNKWVPFVVGERKEIVTALDWTEFDGDDHSTIALYVVTAHGRSTPLIWRTVVKSELEGWRNAHEDALLEQFEAALPDAVKVTILADRGFGDQKLYEHLRHLGFDFVIRFRGCILVTDSDGVTLPASDRVPNNGRPRLLRDAFVTADKTHVPAVVCVKARGMADPWLLASSRADLTGAEIVKLYGRRFTIEETFRDTKNLRYGMGLSATRIGSPDRRDRLLFLGAMAHALLTLLGAAAEATGLDRTLKVNTVKRRTHSLYRQGCFWYGAIPNMPVGDLHLLMREFGRIVSAHAVFREIFGAI